MGVLPVQDFCCCHGDDMHQQCITQESNKKASVVIKNMRSIKTADIIPAAGGVALNVHD